MHNKLINSIFKFRYLVMLCWFFNMSCAYACECNDEDVVNIENIVLTNKFIAKIEILEPSYIDRIIIFIGIGDARKEHEYKIRTLEALKGKSDLHVVRVTPPTSENCSFDVKTSRVRYIFLKNKEIAPVIGICNSISDDKLKYRYGDLLKYIAISKTEIEPPDLSKWKVISRDKFSENLADIKNIVKNEPGHYSLWTLHNNENDHDLSAARSIKAEIKISCPKKMFSIKSEYRFSERNGGGDVVLAENFAKYDKYHWIPIKKGYPLDTLTKLVCEQ